MYSRNDHRFQAYPVIAFAALLLAVPACDLPKDPQSTLDRARGAALRVGVANNPPWVILGAGTPQGIEPVLLSQIAGEASIRIQWVPGAESELLMALKHHELDVVAAGLTADLPWKTDLGFTKPYYTDSLANKDHVLAVAPGENALLVHLERGILRRKAGIPALVRSESR